MSFAVRTSTINNTLGDANYDPHRLSTKSSNLNRLSTISSARSDFTNGTWDDNDGKLPPDPADLFLERVRGWRNLIHVLLLQFQEQASVEKGYLKSTEKTMGFWNKESSLDRDLAFGTEENNMTQFMGNLREYAHRLGKEHEAVFRVLHEQTIPTLQAIDKDAEAKIKSLNLERKQRLKQRIKDEKKLRLLVQSLQKSLASHKGTNGTYSVFQTGDPWLCNLAVRKHLFESMHRHEGNVRDQGQTETSFSIWEMNVINNMKAAITHYTALTGVSASHESTSFLRDALNALDHSSTWEHFREGRLAAAQNPDGPSVNYAGVDDDFTSAIKEGPIMRKSKLLKQWKDAYWVLTSAGWLHEFKARPQLDGHEPVKPSKSIWLRSCTLTPLGGLTDGLPAEFHLVERADKAGGVTTKKGKTHKYMTNTPAESQIWWNGLADFASGALGYTNKYGHDERSSSRLAQSVSRNNTLSPHPVGAAERSMSVASTASSSGLSVNDAAYAKAQNGVHSSGSSISDHNHQTSTAVASPSRSVSPEVAEVGAVEAVDNRHVLTKDSAHKEALNQLKYRGSSQSNDKNADTAPAAEAGITA